MCKGRITHTNILSVVVWWNLCVCVAGTALLNMNVKLTLLLVAYLQRPCCCGNINIPIKHSPDWPKSVNMSTWTSYVSGDYNEMVYKIMGCGTYKKAWSVELCFSGHPVSPFSLCPHLSSVSLHLRTCQPMLSLRFSHICLHTSIHHFILLGSSSTFWQIVVCFTHCQLSL